MSEVRWLSVFFNDLIWYLKTDEKVLYLTFDDGPSENTEWILNKLQSFNAKATFFCLGENVARYPGQFKKILEAGHSVGNHCYSHLRGWKSTNKVYFDDIHKACQLINSNLFRPPYGQISLSQIKHLKQRYKIVMWDVMTKDYKKKKEPEELFRKIVQKARPGSILVFHDSNKASRNMKPVLTKVLDYYDQQGYRFRSILFQPAKD